MYLVLFYFCYCLYLLYSHNQIPLSKDLPDVLQEQPDSIFTNNNMSFLERCTLRSALACNVNRRIFQLYSEWRTSSWDTKRSVTKSFEIIICLFSAGQATHKASKSFQKFNFTNPSFPPYQTMLKYSRDVESRIGLNIVLGQGRGEMKTSATLR